MSLWRPEFVDGLRLLARISEDLARNGLPRPILVGGAAVEYYTGGWTVTGGFDLCSPVQEPLEESMQRHGFVRPSGPGQLTRGWVHPDLRLGFELVSSAPMGGLAAPTRLVLVDGIEPGAGFVLISVEDLIADRMGQYASGTAPDMLAQAQELLALHPDADMAYLDARVRHETLGDYGAADILKGK